MRNQTRVFLYGQFLDRQRAKLDTNVKRWLWRKCYRLVRMGRMEEAYQWHYRLTRWAEVLVNGR